MSLRLRAGSGVGFGTSVGEVFRAKWMLGGLSAVALAMACNGVAARVAESSAADASRALEPGVFKVVYGALQSPTQPVSAHAPLQVLASGVAFQRDLCHATATLVGPAGAEEVAVTCAGDVLNLRPARDLLPAAHYTLMLQWPGASRLQSAVFSTQAIEGSHATPPIASIASTAASTIEEWRPDASPSSSWYYAWGEKPMAGPTPLTAPAGHTGVYGRLARFNGQPIVAASVSVDGIATRTDAQGRFLLPDVPAGSQVLRVDGTQVWSEGGHFTKHYLHIDVASDKTTTLGRPIYLARVDPATEVSLASPSDRDVVLTHPAMPGVEVRIPKGMVLRDQDGALVTKVSLTPVPIDRAPYATPLSFPLYFTLQPGGAIVDASSGKQVQVTYPNYQHVPAGTAVDFWNYDPRQGWKIYGRGKPNADGKTIVADGSDKGLTLREVMTFGYGLSSAAPVQGPIAGGTRDGDPVDVATGVYVAERTDLSISDVTPIGISRSYQQNDTNNPHEFGPGWGLKYDMSLYSPATSEVDLVLADSTRIAMLQQSDGSFKCTSIPAGAFFGARLTQITNSSYPHPLQWQIALLDQTKLIFDGDAPNQLLEIIDRNGNVVSITRDGNLARTGDITKIVSPNGRSIQFTYSGAPGSTNNHVVSATDNVGRLVNYGYDASSVPRLVSVADADQTSLPSGQQALVKYVYDTNSRLWKIYDKRNNLVLTNVYNAAGQMQQQTMADGSTWYYSYSFMGSPTIASSMTVTNPRQYTTNYTFNSNGYLTQTVVAANATAPFAPQTTKILLDSNNFPISTTDPLQRVTNFGYDAAGNLAALTVLANRSSETATRHYAFEPNFNQLANYTSEVGATTAMGYDSFGNLASLTSAQGATWTFTSNDQGLMQQVTTPAGYSTVMNFNLADLASVTDANGRTTQFDRDDLGRVDAITDPAGNLTQFSYDAKDRTTTIVDALSQTTSIGYDANGNLQSVLLPSHVDPYGFAYDVRNNLQTQTDPLNRSATLNYDANGNPKLGADAKQQSTSYVFDPFDRPQEVDFNDGSSIKFTFDAGNRLRQVVDSVAGTTNLTPDDYDRPSVVATPYGTVNYQFDAAGRLQTMTYPSGTIVSYHYNGVSNELATVALNTDANPFIIGYDADDRFGTLTQPNGVNRTQGYNNSEQLQSIAYASGGTALGDWSYGYDAAGRLQASGGALLNPVAPIAMQTATFDDANQVATLNGSTLTEDANGSQTTDASLSFGYDVRGRLRTATSSAGVATYTVNAFGMRDTKVFNGTTTHYIYDLAGHVIVETDGNNNTQREYVWIGDMPVMVRVFSSGVATEYYVWSDRLNTPRVITDTKNNLVWRWDSDAYGNGVANGNLGNVPGLNFTFNLRFPGQYYDVETGLHYNAARDYNPKTGRYVQSDPIGVDGGMNTYAYVGGDPIGYVDYLGLDRWATDAGRAIIYTQQDLGRTIFYNATNGDFFSFDTRSQVTRAAARTGADGPYSGSYTYCERGHLPRAFGTAKMRTTDGRDRWIHGGGSGLENPWAPHQGWKPTEGCTRAQNSDVNTLCNVLDMFKAANPQGTIIYRRDRINP